MSMRVGVALARDAVRAVAIRRERVVWAAEARVGSDASLAGVIASLLAECPVSRFPQPTLCAAIGPHAAQVKLVMGFPDTPDDATMRAVLRENAAAFFLKNGVPLLTTGVRTTSPGTVLAAAVDEPCVAAVRVACRARGWRFGFLVPTPLALTHAFTDPSFAWTDGHLVVEVDRTDSAGLSIRIRPAAAAASTATPHPVAGLASLGEEAFRYADAYGAACDDEQPPLALDAFAAGMWTAADVRRRLILPALVTAAGIAALVLSPLAAHWAAKRAETRMARVRDDQWQAVTTAISELDRVTAVLDDAGQFAASRSSPTRLLGDLARALPQGSVVVSLELGEQQGQIVALTKSPAAVLATVRRLPGAAAVEMVGPVRRDAAAAGEAQRVSVRWRREHP